MGTPEKSSNSKRARLHRMVMDDHICPYGLKTKHLLEKHDFEIEDRWLTSREETDAFQQKHSVDTTPQVFTGGERIGATTSCGSISTSPCRTSRKPAIGQSSLSLSRHWPSASR
jgi:glutaredoxin